MATSAHPQAAAIFTAVFQRRTLRREDDSTVACGLSQRGGSIERSRDGRDQERGQYTLTLPAETLVELGPDEEFTIDEEPGRRFVVVWTPPAGNLNLSRRYGVNEVR